jgi:hypothetical protein
MPAQEENKQYKYCYSPHNVYRQIEKTKTQPQEERDIGLFSTLEALTSTFQP